MAYDTGEKPITLYEEEISRLLTAISMGATVNISSEVLIELKEMVNVDRELLNGYKPKFTVLLNGYYNYNLQKTVNPNMHTILELVDSAIHEFPN